MWSETVQWPGFLTCRKKVAKVNLKLVSIEDLISYRLEKEEFN
jgi:hypothetical protein